MRRMVMILLCFVFLLAACAAPEVVELTVANVPTAVPATESAAPTAVPTPIPPTVVSVRETAVSEPTPAAEPTAPPEPTAVSATDTGKVTAGRTDDGAFFLGDPNAPLTVIDYSDFL
ncbi:MAG: hypothetical protein KDE56_01585 [Anaerolineales bacterium]|nr:hypothetical protein [Anaerolineales bacterium]